MGPYSGALPARRPTSHPVRAARQPRLVRRADGVPPLLLPGRRIGGWRTEQRRSYFAVKLPQRWWLLGLDIQFDTYIDEPQVKYFEETLTANLSPGDGVILCSASPLWVKTVGDPDAFNSIEWFERKFVRSRLVAGTDLANRPGPRSGST